MPVYRQGLAGAGSVRKGAGERIAKWKISLK
jgi:hypothetical protein